MPQEGWVPGQPFHTGPIVTTAGRVQTFGGEGGGYVYSRDINNWGLNTSGKPHASPEKLKPIFPSLMEEFMGEQLYNQSLIDNEYSKKFETMFADTERELAEKTRAAKRDQPLMPAASAEIDQKAALDLIDSKDAKYGDTAPKIYGMYGQSPYFLMDVMSRRMMNVALGTQTFTLDIYKLFDDVYKSAMEIKLLSLSAEVLAGKLDALDKQRALVEESTSLDDAARSQAMDTQIAVIAQERDIYTQRLPEFLQKEFVSTAGSVAGKTPSQALLHYKATLDRLAATKLSEIKPIQAPPPFSSGGVTVHFPPNNPKINAPLSKPELEALSELINLQHNTSLGTKWVTYHEALLLKESSRVLTAASERYAALAERADRAEQTKDAIKFTTDFYAALTEKFGDKASTLAKELAQSAKGKKIRSASEAIEVFEKHKDAINHKFGAQDKQAISNALNSMDKALMAKNLATFSKGFGGVGKVMDYVDAATAFNNSVSSGDWKPFLIKVETLVAGNLATALVAFAFGLTATTPIGIIAFAVLMAVTSAYVDEKFITIINRDLLGI